MLDNWLCDAAGTCTALPEGAQDAVWGKERGEAFSQTPSLHRLAIGTWVVDVPATVEASAAELAKISSEDKESIRTRVETAFREARWTLAEDSVAFSTGPKHPPSQQTVDWAAEDGDCLVAVPRGVTGGGVMRFSLSEDGRLVVAVGPVSLVMVRQP